MQGLLSFFQISLISTRIDVIHFVKSICSEDIKVSVISSFGEVNFSDATLLLIDVSIFNGFDKAILSYAESYSPFSICSVTSRSTGLYSSLPSSP